MRPKWHQLVVDGFLELSDDEDELVEFFRAESLATGGGGGSALLMLDLDPVSSLLISFCTWPPVRRFGCSLVVDASLSVVVSLAACVA